MLFWIIAAIGANIIAENNTVFDNVSKCKIVIPVSHLGMGWMQPASYAATYSIATGKFDTAWIASIGKPRFIITNFTTASAYLVGTVNFTVNWWGCNDEIYILFAGGSSNYTYGCGDEYCQVIGLHFGKDV